MQVVAIWVATRTRAAQATVCVPLLATRVAVQFLTPEPVHVLTYTMEYIKTLLLLTLCACGDANEALSAAMQRRRDAHPVYARQYSEDYEPYAYAAIPLHAPLPIVHLLSPSPNKYIQNQKQRTRQPVDRDLHAYSSSQAEEYEPYEYNYAYSPNIHKYASSAAVEEESQPVVIYARPNKNGGYSYRKRPSAVTPAPRPKREPIVFRIHKYKITKE